MDTTWKHCLTFVLFLFVNCKADHFRGGTISWKPTGIGHEVEFTYKLGFRFNHGPGCNSSLIGSYVDNWTYDWVCSSGCRTPVTLSSKGYICKAASSTQDWELGEYTFRYTFSSGGKFTVSFSTCCWIKLSNVTNNAKISIPTTVDLRTRSDLKVPNTSPVAASKPSYTIKHGCTQTIKIPVLDQDGDNVKCRRAVGSECGDICSSIPNTILTVWDNCTLTIKANGNKGDMYAVAVMIEDMPRDTITLGGETFTSNNALSSVPVQFLVHTPDIPSRTCSDKPVFVSPTPVESSVIALPPGKSLFLGVFATSGGSSIKEFQAFGPPGLQKSSIRQLSLSPQVYSVDLTWVPTVADKGSHSLCIEATDTHDIISDMRCMIIATWDVNPCDSDQCQNCGTCSRVGTSDAFTCSCTDGFTGTSCETDIDECQSGPCFNSGTCHDITNGYTCECVPGYTGVFCEIDIDECKIDPCMNSGTCFDLINSFFCGCVDGYTGDQCEIDINECQPDPCVNGGNCTDLIGSFMCTCLPGFTGTVCQSGINPCHSDPCKNDGICVTYNSTYFECDCVDGWEGVNCAYRQQNESFINSSLMVNSHMHYSECNCFLGQAKHQLCYKYKIGQSVGYGVLGTFLGILTAVGFYATYLLFLDNTEPISKVDEDRSKDDYKEKVKQQQEDNKVSEEVKANEKPPESVQVKQHSHGHRHRKCWACEVKYNGVPPPMFWGK